MIPSLRVYLGTIPDYGSGTNNGVTITGVKPSSPAEKAGLKGGDIITRLAGFEIKNLYDYAHTLGVLQPGKEVTIEILRNGKKLNLLITPVSKV